MAFPQTRMRRMRASASLRGLVRENELRAGQLVLPLFVAENPTHSGSSREPIATDQDPAHPFERLSISALLDEAHEVAALGIAGVMLFGIPAVKDAEGSGAWDEEGVIQTAVRALKQAVPELLVLTDVCLCEYTDHGHCGVLRSESHPPGGLGSGSLGSNADSSPIVDNDATLELLARVAVSHARAGADLVAPSDMMDGRVGAIRGALDEEGFAGTRRPPRLSDGSRQRSRGRARGAARRAGGR